MRRKYFNTGEAGREYSDFSVDAGFSTIVVSITGKEYAGNGGRKFSDTVILNKKQAGNLISVLKDFIDPDRKKTKPLWIDV